MKKEEKKKETRKKEKKWLIRSKTHKGDLDKN